MLQRAKQKLQITQAVIEKGSFGQIDTNNSSSSSNDDKKDLTSKENLFSVIKYSLRDVFGEDYSVSPITDKDIDMILNPSKSDDNNSQNSTKKSSSLDSDSCDTNVASFGGTLELMDESDSDDDDEAVVYDVNNLPASKKSFKRR